MTHRLPVDARRNGRKRQALCGAWIELRDHRNEPECPECAAMASALRLDENLDVAELFGRDEEPPS